MDSFHSLRANHSTRWFTCNIENHRARSEHMHCKLSHYAQDCKMDTPDTTSLMTETHLSRTGHYPIKELKANCLITHAGFEPVLHNFCRATLTSKHHEQSLKHICRLKNHPGPPGGYTSQSTARIPTSSIKPIPNNPCHGNHPKRSAIRLPILLRLPNNQLFFNRRENHHG